jgi:hypothetical protein
MQRKTTAYQHKTFGGALVTLSNVAVIFILSCSA